MHRSAIALALTLLLTHFSPLLVQATPFTAITVSPSNTAAGAATLYDISFTADTSIANTDTLVIGFQSGFDVSNVVVAAPVSGMDGGLTVTIRNQEVLLARDGTGTAVTKGSPVTIRFGNVTNTIIAGSTYVVTLTVRDATGTNKDTGNSDVFSITAGSLDHFVVTAAGGGNIGTQVAGTSFNIKLEAQDANNNTVTSFNSTVSLSDATGTISPGTSNAFTNGVLASQTVTITKAQAGVTITAASGGITGTSNGFTVDPGALTKFSLSQISSPQTAGAAFSITMTALDANNNTVTNFSGTATVSISSGQISPSTTNAFTNGVLTQSFTATTAQTDAVVTVTSSGSNGQSNAFNVNPGAVASFVISPFSATQVAGTPFEITITAQDANGNTVTGYTGTVSLSQSAGTISPTTSGSFIAGVRTEQVTITGTATGTTITVQDGGNQGTSDPFDVVPGALADFSVTTITGGSIPDQTAGSPFTIRIIAQDANGNTVTGFTSTVTISDLSGQITPTTSSSFTAGVLASQTVWVNQSRANNVISVSASGITGSSNSFNVTQGTLHHVLVRTAPGGSGIEFATYAMTADDTVNVYAAGYDIGNTYLGDVSVVWSLTGGLAGEQAGGSGTSFTFKPTTASITGTIGTIFADHATAIDDATGNITVTPGTPANKLVLTPVPSSLDADGSSLSVITSATVTDADGNSVGAGREFTVLSVPTGVGSIPSAQDTNPTLSNVQVKTNASSQLNFNFQAGLIGGIAQIFVNSTNGAASGDTTVSVSGMDLLTLASPTQVSRGQNPAQVTMTVQNNSASPFVISAAGLDFRGTGGVDRNADYPTATRADTFTVIPAGLTRNLLFNVAVSATATLDTITIAGSVSGTIDGTAISDNVAQTVAGWRVKLGAKVFVDAVNAPATVTQGQSGLNVSVTVQNLSGFSQVADLLVDSVNLIFRDGAADVTSQYIVTPSSSNPDTIPGGSSKTFNFLVDVKATANLGQITIDAQASGRDINSNASVSDNGASITAAWDVLAGAALQITSITTPRSVTAGVQGTWLAKMALQNNSNSQIDIDINNANTFIRLFLGAQNVTGQYTISKATVLTNSGSTILQPNSSDTLAFTISKTGTSTGDINITGSVVGTDIGPNKPISDTTDDLGQGLVRVQTPANLNITGLVLSQATVTQNQSSPWTATVAVENTGQADILLDLGAAATRLFFANQLGYTMTPPAALRSAGDDTLRGNTADSLIFTITQTGSAVGANSINARVQGTEINRRLAVQDSTTSGAGNQATVTVQTPASFAIDSTYIFAPNAPFVDVRDTFKVKVRFANAGQEPVQNLQVSLTTDGTSRLQAPNPVVVPLLPGEGAATAEFAVVADSNAAATELFTAAFISAVSGNTGAALNAGTALDDTAAAVLQLPAVLSIEGVLPSSASVSANQTNPPWLIYVVLRNTGKAPILFDPPAPGDISFRVDGFPQQGLFTVEAPIALNRSGALRLADGLPDTLTYRVTRTGPNGGTATITATISGRDANNNSVLQRTAAGTVDISTSAAVGITGTKALAKSYNGTGIALVNTNQIYAIRVYVRNTGLEPVRDVYVSLRTNGSASLQLSQKRIPEIGLNSLDSLTFQITAAAIPNLNGEVFTAEIDSATAVNSNKKLTPLAPSDPTERVITQTPAQLTVLATMNPPEGKLSLNQEFQVTATVVNAAGAADVDNSGEVTITEIPAGYTQKNPVAEPLTRSFTLGVPVTWTFIAPAAKATSDSFWFSISKKPLDLNSGLEAGIGVGLDFLPVETDQVSLTIDSLYVSSPAGATDSTVSTAQIFIVRVHANVSANLSNPQATLTLPPGYEFRFTNDQTKPLISGSASWEVIAPSSQTTTDNLSVRTFAQTADQSTVEDSAILPVTTVEQAIVLLAAEIIDPPGASLGSLARNQEFKLRATLTNQGTAQTIGAGEVQLQLGATGVTTNDPLTRSITVGTAVVWTLKAPAQATPSNPITVSLTKEPLDENTGKSAAVSGGARNIVLQVQTRELGLLTAGPIQIVSPAGAQDSVVSTDQQFTVQAAVSWQDAADITAEIIFPAGSGYSADNVVESAQNTANAGNETFQWVITAPALPRVSDDLYVAFRGRDAADTTKLGTNSAMLPVTAVEKARIFLSADIVNPPSARDKKVSPDQIFTVRATITNLGQADTTGSSQIQIKLPLDYTTADPVVRQTVNGIADWAVRSPAVPHDDIRNIEVIVVDTPRDENSGQKLELDITKESIGITTETSKLQVQNLALQRSSAVVSGQQNVEMFRFKAANTGEVGASNILLKGISVDLVDREGNSINASDVVARVRVRNTRTGREFIDLNSGLNASTLQLNFPNPDTLLPQTPDSVSVYVDVSNSQAVKSFHLLLSGTNNIDAIDQESQNAVLVQLINELNQSVSALQSLSAVLIANDFATSFKNKPNPFNPETDGGTRFTYVLPQSSNVELHIYTLFGELVTIMRYSASDPQGMARGMANEILWNGRNGPDQTGQVVLNGVYLAVLKTEFGTATTRVAVIK